MIEIVQSMPSLFLQTNATVSSFFVETSSMFSRISKNNYNDFLTKNLIINTTISESIPKKFTHFWNTFQKSCIFVFSNYLK